MPSDGSSDERQENRTPSPVVGMIEGVGMFIDFLVMIAWPISSCDCRVGYQC